MQDRRPSETSLPINSQCSTSLGIDTVRQFWDYWVLLQIVPVSVRTPQGAVETYALLDSESQTSLNFEEFADKIGPQGKPSVL